MDEVLFASTESGKNSVNKLRSTLCKRSARCKSMTVACPDAVARAGAADWP